MKSVAIGTASATQAARHHKPQMRLIGTELWITRRDGFLRINLEPFTDALLVLSIVFLVAVLLI